MVSYVEVLAVRAYLLIFLTITVLGAFPGPASAQEADPPNRPGPEILKRVVIDPGHGGEDHGVTGPAGLTESRLTLAIARQLKLELQEKLGLWVFLTRSRDEKIELAERTATVNRLRGHLFLSIHAGGAVQRWKSGARVFHEDDRLQTGSNEPEAAASSDPDSPVKWSQAQKSHQGNSRLLANEINLALASLLQHQAGPIKGLPLAVLTGADCPAVLIEVGYLSNPEEERRLMSQSYRDNIVEAVVRGIDVYRTMIQENRGQ